MIILQYFCREKYVRQRKEQYKLFLAKIEIEECSPEIGRSLFSFHFATLPEKDDISSDSKMQADWCGVT